MFSARPRSLLSITARVIVIGIATGFFAPCANAQFPTQGLVLYYPFNGNALDASGSNNNGTAVNVTPTADRNGKANSAFYFNGTNSYVSFPDAVFGAATPGFTYSLWMRPDSVQSPLTVPFNKGSTAGETSALWNPSQTISAQTKFSDAEFPRVSGTAIYPLGYWVHVVVVYQKAQRFELWANGQLVASTTPPNLNLNTGTNPSSIGADFQNGNPTLLFKGAIDEVRVYNLALSSTQVQQLYAAETAGVAVQTGSASGIYGTGATLNATIFAGGTASAQFQYGTTVSYGNTTAPAIVTGTAAQAFSANVTGLTPNTTYHFRIIGTSSSNTAQGSDVTFTTAIPPPPALSTGGATGISVTSATLNGAVNAQDAPTTFQFQYGLTTAYGSATAPQNAGNGTILTPVAAQVAGLLPATSYHFLLTASNAGGTASGVDQVFSTLPGDVQSGWSNVVTSVQDNTPPSLAVTAPADQSSTTFSDLLFQGTASDMSGVHAVTVNGQTAATSDAYGHWTAHFSNLKSGSNAFTVQAADNAVPPNIGTLTVTLSGIAPFSTFGDGLPDAWKLQHGLDPGDNGSISLANGAFGDPAGDSIPNLMKYALNLDPQAVGVSGLPTVSLQCDPSDGQTYLTFTYNRLLSGIGITYIVEVTSDLVTWSSDPSQVQELFPATLNLDGVSESVNVRILPSINAPGTKDRMVRLRVTAP